jgi:hypothetical protein
MATERSFSSFFLLKTKTTTTSKLLQWAWKKQKTIIENDNVEKFNKVQIFDNTNKLIDGNTINLGDLVSIKCHIRYWRHFASKKHGLTLKLTIVKLLDQSNN